MNEKDEPRAGHGRPAAPGTTGPAERPLTPVRPWLRAGAGEQDAPAAASESEPETGSESGSAEAAPAVGDDATQARPAARPEHRPGVLSP
ncbi:MAG TPA: hypothetical protein VFE40_08730, partial [Jatrophihabitantaceae bacterium]|nr:hypothetical protein [Jatrophihabitantaceae bacterium]